MSLTVADLVAKMGLDESEFDRKLGQSRDSAVRFARKDINPNLGLDDSEFDRKLAQDKKKMSSLGDGMKGKLGSIASTGALAGVTALAGGMVAGAYTGIKYNSTIEQTTIAMGVMLGSTEKAKTLIKEVEKMAAATPFQFPELADATKRLVAYGFAAGEAVPLMTRLGDISSALQIPIGEMADLYGKMKVAGRVSMEDINQLAERGVPIYSALAGALGVGQEEIRGLVETGKVGFPQIEKAISSMTSKGGMFAGMMAKQSKSFAGLGSTLADTITQALGDAMKPAFEWLKKTMDKQLNDKDSPLMKFMKVIKNTMPGIAKSAGEIAQALAPIAFLVEKIAGLQKAAPWLQDIFNWLTVIQTPMASWFKIMKLIRDVSDKIGRMLAKIASFVFPQPPGWLLTPLSTLGITPQPATGGAAGAPAAKPSGNLLGSIIGRLPGLASGGYVPARPGGTAVVLGEAGEGETVTPDSKMRGGLTVHAVVNFNGPVVGGRAGLREVSDIVKRDIMAGVRRGLVGQNA